MQISPIKLEAGTFTGPQFDQAFASAMRKASVCPPPVENSASPAVTAPVVDGQGVGIQRLSNLDLNGKLVKRGVTVSHHGLRFLVTKVSRGWFYGQRFDAWGHAYGLSRSRLQCEQVQVVA